VYVPEVPVISGEEGVVEHAVAPVDDQANVTVFPMLVERFVTPSAVKVRVGPVGFGAGAGEAGLGEGVL
jgi:hypothetical protein